MQANWPAPAEPNTCKLSAALGRAAAPRVLVLSDDARARIQLRVGLAAHGYHVLEAQDPDHALALALDQKPLMMLMELRDGLPGQIRLTQGLRAWTSMPIVVLSPSSHEDDVVACLDAGADDYVVRPFDLNVLLARLRRCMRRSLVRPDEPTRQFGSPCVDLARHRVTRDGVALHLTPVEYKLLQVLASHAGSIVTHQQILKEVWGLTALKRTHYIRVQVAELRKKVEADPAHPRHLLTTPTVGYRLVPA